MTLQWHVSQFWCYCYFGSLIIDLCYVAIYFVFLFLSWSCWWYMFSLFTVNEFVEERVLKILVTPMWKIPLVVKGVFVLTVDCHWPWQPIPWLLEAFLLVLGTGLRIECDFILLRNSCQQKPGDEGWRPIFICEVSLHQTLG